VPLRGPLNGRVITHQQRSPRCSAVCPPRLPEADAWESSFAISTPLSAPEGDQIPEARDITLSREQVYRLVAQVPERLSLMTLAALCDILGCAPSDLVEPYRASRTPAARRDTSADLPPRPKRARVLPLGPD
jgi:hypothetical protein